MNMSESTDQATRTGSCLCGNVKYTLTGEPSNAFLCHCVSCRKFTGAPFWGCGLFETKNIAFQDPVSCLKTYKDSATDSGVTLNRQFCLNCGSSISVSSSVYGGLATIAIGTLDKGQKAWKATVECYAGDGLGWCPGSEGVKVYQGPADISDY